MKTLIAAVFIILVSQSLIGAQEVQDHSQLRRQDQGHEPRGPKKHCNKRQRGQQSQSEYQGQQGQGNRRPPPPPRMGQGLRP